MGTPGGDHLTGGGDEDDDFEEDPEEDEYEEDPEEDEAGEVAAEEEPEEEEEEEEEEEAVNEEPEELEEEEEELEDKNEAVDEELEDEGEEELEDEKEAVDEEIEDEGQDELEEVRDAAVVEELEEEFEEEYDDEEEQLEEKEGEDEDEQVEEEDEDEFVEEEQVQEDEEEEQVEEEEDEDNEEEHVEEEEGDEFEEVEEEVDEDEEAADEMKEEVGAENYEEAGQIENKIEEADKPSFLPTSSETDTADILSCEKQIGKKTDTETDTDVPCSELRDSEDIKSLIFNSTEPLTNENGDFLYKEEGVNKVESDCGQNEISQLVDKKEANGIQFIVMHGDSRSVEAAGPLSTNTSISIEPEAIKYDKVDCDSEGTGVNETKFDGQRKHCEYHSIKDAEVTDFCAHHIEPNRIEATKFLSSDPSISMEPRSIKNEEVNSASVEDGMKRMESCSEEKCINNKVAESNNVYAPSSDSKSAAEKVKPLCSIGLNSGSVLMQEGGVEDMELDSEENVVHGSDVDGTVVDSIQENIASNNHLEVSFNIGADALNNNTVVAGSLKSSSLRGVDTMHNHVMKLGESTNMNLQHITPKSSSMTATSGKQQRLPPVTQLMDMNKRPTIICSYFAKGWCIKGNSCRFRHVKENEDNTSKPLEGENQVARENHAWQSNNKLGFSSLESQLAHSAKPEFGCGVVASSSAFASNLRPLNVNAISLFNDPLQSIANRYINQHLHPSAATDGCSSHYISPVEGSSNSLISLNSNPYDAHKLLSEATEFNASSSSLGLRAQRDLLNSLGVASKTEMYKWEQSKPFRPSYIFSIPSGSSPGNMYDPLLDSIEHTSLGSGSFRAEPIHYPSHQGYPASAGNHSELDVFNGTVLNRYGHSRVTALPVTEAEAAESSVADQGYLGSAIGGDKGSGISHGKDLSVTNKSNTVSAEKKSKVIKEIIHGNEIVGDRGLTEVDQRESKTFRQFRVALIEFIKELLKPAWRMGNLSKDAHNLIVKKAVTKVLSSIHGLQVPSTTESVQQYLSSSQPKITKLLEVYVQKHKT